MSKKNRCNNWYKDNFWQSDNFNVRSYSKNLDMLLSLAMNRFRWEGLPNTCDSRFLERSLHRNGIASISFDTRTPDIWDSLIAMSEGEFNKYGIPTRWRAIGYNPKDTGYEVTPDNGELVFYSWSRAGIWSGLELFARKLTHYERTEDINLAHQQKPIVFVVPDRSKKLEVSNIMQQTLGGEPAILINRAGMGMIEEITKIDTQVPFIAEDLALAKKNVMFDALMWLGIPHLAFEKGERMIEDEARANTAPTNIMLLNCLNARRDACKRLREKWPNVFSDLNVYFNDDFESYNYNYINNIEAQAQDGLLGGIDNEI